MAKKDKMKSKHLPHGVETIIGKDGKTRYYFKGKEYDSPKDIPAPTWNWLNKAGEKVSNNRLVQSVAPALQKFGELTELPGEEAWGNQVGLSAQKYGIPYNIGKTFGLATFPGFGELKGGTKALTSNKLKLQPALATVGPDSLKIPPKFQPPPGQPLAIKGLSGSSPIKPKKNVKGFTGNVYEVSKKEIPQIKQQLGEWLNQQLKEKGNVKNINRQDFGTIIIDGEPREISRITNYLTGDGKLPLLPKVVTRKQAAFKRIQATQPPKNELTNLGRQLGLTTEQINEYYQEAVAGFKGVRDAAARNSKFKGEYHAGHFYPASRGGPTSRRSAGIELGKQNVTKGSKLEGSINIYAAQKAGIPTTWAEDMKMWFRDKKGLPGPRYESDFSNAQRNVIESIPWDATQEQVEAIWKQHNLDKIPNIEQYKAVERELTPRALQIGGDRR
tara:strand:- start:26 stop:1357 length:1332 start_codon:yes stop_codon:yes gene_type:complete